MTVVDLAWMDQAACAAASARYGEQTVETWFFPEHGHRTTKARRICAECPVRDDCENHVLTGTGGWQEYGIWAGKLMSERRDKRQAIRDTLNSGCGTNAGYTRHIANGETPCDSCRAAKAEYMVEYRRKKTLERAA